jgi:integrating conjugative element protein (TIGR03765 family)
MNRIRAISIVLAGASWVPLVAWAQLVIIYDSGATRPLAPLLSVFGETTPSAPAPREPSQVNDLGAADLSRLLPIRSPRLTPGSVTRRPLSLPNNGVLPRPFFLIGADERSRKWLATHRDRLKSIGAVGMLVQAESVNDVEAIVRIGAGLSILPASATDIARVLGIEHVPVLVSRRGIEQ